MLIGGEKWACDACVRGHRVSNCQHSGGSIRDPLVWLAAVADCHHCRGLRKSRSAHVKCDCGEGGAHHGQGQCGHGDKSHAHGAANQHDQGAPCCCSHGGRCSCALKKEPQLPQLPQHHLDPVPELDAAAAAGRDHDRTVDFPKPRLATANSEGALTVFANGHHKPVHKHNHMSQKCGVPYTIPRPHTVHGQSEMARRSVDSLPATTPVDAAHAPSPIADSIASAQQDVRLVRSEHGSPHPSSACGLDEHIGQLPPLDLSFSDFGVSAAASRSQMDLHSVTSAPFDNYFCATPDTDQPILSAGLDAPSVDWSHFDLPLNATAFSSSLNQPPSFASFDYRNLAGPAMSNASSGEPSELGDYVPFGNPSPIQPPSLVHNRFPSDSSDICESESYRLSGTSSLHGLPQMSMLASSNLESLDIDDYINGAATSATPFASPEHVSDTPARGLDRYGAASPHHHTAGPTSVPADDAFTAGPYGLEKAQQKRGPTSVPRDDIGFSLAAADADEPSWIPQYDPSAAAITLPEVDAAQAVWTS
ncbi:MAG: hypothetical protein M1832_006181 [Thelocarpon impressellum]|nr:MAG: hypothetical protein M1832_006181 [Thelocarpon impressellum]